MKKVMLFIAAAMMVFASCNKDNKGGNKTKPGGGDEEGEELILIDGDFADWAALQSVVSAKRSTTYIGEELSETEHYRIDALKEMKVAADQYNIYFYFEVDESIMYRAGVDWENKPTSDGYAAHLQIHFDTDLATVLKDPNDPESSVKTGYVNWIYDDPGIDYYFEASEIFSTDPAKVGEMAGGVLLKYVGPAGADLWDEDPPLQEEVTGEGICAGWGVLGSDKIIRYEISLTRSFLNLHGASKKIAVGAELFQDANWELMGLLPQANTGAEGVWTGRFLEVTLP